MSDMQTVVCVAEVLEDSETPGQAEIHGHLDEDGKVVGWTVECLIRQGPPGFPEMHVIATLSCPVGEEIPNLPQLGQTLLICSVQGDPNDWYVIGALPGGINRKIPRNAAGVDMSGNGLAKTQVNMPPKGVGIRYYVRGAAFVIKLKGVSKDYKGELFIEADDAAESIDGNPTFIRMIRMPDSMADAEPDVAGKMAIKIRTAQGAAFEMVNDKVVQRSGDGKNSLEVGNGGIKINGLLLQMSAQQTISMDGVIIENWLPADGVPPAGIPGPRSVLHGTTGVDAVPSIKHFIGSTG